MNIMQRFEDIACPCDQFELYKLTAIKETVRISEF